MKLSLNFKFLVKVKLNVPRQDIVERKLNDIRCRTVLPYIKGKLLDIACGSNQLVREYYGSGIGVDILSYGYSDVHVLKNFGHLDFDNETFDTITILAALNHIPNREEVLKEAFRILKKNGRIIITMLPPRFSRFWHFVRRPWADEIEKDFEHGQVYGIANKELIRLLQESGFKIILKKKFMLRVNTMIIAKTKT